MIFIDQSTEVKNYIAIFYYNIFNREEKIDIDIDDVIYIKINNKIYNNLGVKKFILANLSTKEYKIKFNHFQGKYEELRRYNIDFDISFIETTFEHFFIKNNELHNLFGHALDYKTSTNNFIPFKYKFMYCINGHELEYNDWINHPEKIRYDRNKKLELL
jgi:hypothetical protein